MRDARRRRRRRARSLPRPRARGRRRCDARCALVMASRLSCCVSARTQCGLELLFNKDEKVGGCSHTELPPAPPHQDDPTTPHQGGSAPHQGTTAKVTESRSSASPLQKQIGEGKHVILSYQWDAQDLVKQACKLLNAKGVPTWSEGVLHQHCQAHMADY